MSGYDDGTYASDDALHASAAGTNAVASLQAGHPFSLLLAEDDGQREAGIESLMDAIADNGTRFVRATNPLRARLTLERLLIQVIQGYPDASAGNPAAIIRRIAERRGDETRVVLIIERAETLHPEVLQFFGETATFFPDGMPHLQILFVGRPEFRRMLDDPDAGLDEQTAQLEAYRPVEPEERFDLPPEMEMQVLPQRPLPLHDNSLRAQFRSVWKQGWVTQLGIVGGTLFGAGAIVFAVVIALSGDYVPVQADTGTALLELPDPPESEPDPPVLQPGPPQDAATAALRSEFEAYLTASGRDIRDSTPAQRRTIYQEFLVWRARTGAGRPAR